MHIWSTVEAPFETSPGAMQKDTQARGDENISGRRYRIDCHRECLGDMSESVSTEFKTMVHIPRFRGAPDKTSAKAYDGPE